MKKAIILIIIIILLLIFIIINTSKNIEENEFLELDNYKSKNKERYIKYKEKYSNLNNIDIITKVNLNLDKEFYTNTKKSKYIDKVYVLVNKYNYLDKDYKPDNLKKLTKFSVKNKYLQSIAVNDFYNMCNDAKKEGLNIRVISSYRDFNYQKKLYNNYVLKDGIKNADTYSARPGFSEHQTGLVIDIDNGITNYNNFEDTEEFKWMINNSYKYGFILRYPYGKENITGYNYESWHYRYVGKNIAKYIYENDITFDEYYIKYFED